MDSGLEEEIARLSRPAAGGGGSSGDGGRSEPIHPPGAPASLSTPIVQPQSGRLAAGGADGGAAVHPPRLRRGSSSGSNSGNNLRSPHRSGLVSGAVLAGNSISDLQMPAGSSGSPEQPRRLGGGSGDVGATARASSNGGASAAPPQRRPSANGEKMAGPASSRPALNAEKMAGPSSSRPIFVNGEKVAGFGGAATAAGAGAAAGAAAAAGAKGAKGVTSKQEEAWKKSEAALKKKEQSVRNALKEKQRTLQQESLLLATVDRELAQLALSHQTEVNDLRKTLEVVDRELAFLDRDAQKKLEAFEKARTALSAKVKEKTGITSRLTELIMASEKQRDAKLNEIMKKMSTDGAGPAGGPAGGRGGAAR
ncbi:unnamed protein product [Ectocarpus sp. 6 AP-2014]